MAESQTPITSKLVVNNQDTPATPKLVYSKPVVSGGRLVPEHNDTNPGVKQ